MRKVQLTYKFRLYPKPEQEQKLLWTLDKCRFVYNQMLAGLNGQRKPNKYQVGSARICGLLYGRTAL